MKSLVPLYRSFPVFFFFFAVLLISSCSDDDSPPPLQPDTQDPPVFVQANANSELTDNRLGIGTRVNLRVLAGDTSELVSLKEIRLEVEGANAGSFPHPADSMTMPVAHTDRFSYWRLFEFDETFLQNPGMTKIRVIAVNGTGEESVTSVDIETVPPSVVRIMNKAPTPYGDSLATPFVFSLLPLEQETPYYVPETVTDNPFFQADLMYYLNSTDGSSIASMSEVSSMFTDINITAPKHTYFVKTNISYADFDAIGANDGALVESYYNAAAATNSPVEVMTHLAVGDVIAFKTDNNRYGIFWVENIDLGVPGRKIQFDMKTQY